MVTEQLLPASLTSVLPQASSSASAGAASWRALGSLTRAGTTRGVNQPAEELTARINSSGAGENEIVGKLMGKELQEKSLTALLYIC